MALHTTRRAVLGAALALPAIRAAHAEVSEVLISRQFGTLYLQQDVMETHKLIEKHGSAMGLPNLKASYLRFAGTSAIQEALLAGSLHFASGGVPGALLLWDKTRGAMKSAFAMNATNQRLLTVNPALKTIRDLTPQDRIAMPAVRVSPQAIFLQMAAAKLFGPSEWARFDAQTITRAHPDSMAQMLSKSEINCHFSSTPFQDRELAMPGVHELANSYDIQGVEVSTPNTIYASSAFRAANPIAWRATLAAFQEATDWIVKNPKDAAELYLKSSGDKDTVQGVMAAMSAPGNLFTLKPAGVQGVAAFMAETGIIKRRPDNLADLFFPEAAESGGS